VLFAGRSGLSDGDNDQQDASRAKKKQRSGKEKVIQYLAWDEEEEMDSEMERQEEQQALAAFLADPGLWLQDQCKCFFF
jgi:hypothetical protein